MQERANPLLKYADYYLGRHLVFFLGIFRGRGRKAPENPLRIACLKSAAIGDTVLMTGPLADLKKIYPRAEITFFTGSSNAGAARLFSGADSVIALPMSKPWQALRLIRQSEYDLWIDFDSWPRINAVFTFFSRSKYTVGFQTPQQCRHWIYDQPVLHRKDIHELENYRNLLRAVNSKSQNKSEILSPSRPQIWADRQPFEKSSEPVVLLHPWPGGSQAYFKQWPDEKWIELALALKKNGYRVLLSTGPADRSDSERLMGRAGEGLMEISQVSGLENYLKHLALVDFVITVDTGVAHLAAALGQSVLVLHGPTSPDRWGAIGPRVLTLKDQQPAYIHLGFETSPTASQVLLTSDDVMEILLKNNWIRRR